METLTIDNKTIPFNKNFATFIEDMETAGLDVIHYRGRFYYEGPAVIVSDLQDALGETKVKCQWDNMGFDWVVYPKVSG